MKGVKRINLYEALKKMKYGSDVVYRLVTGVREKIDSLEKILKEIENLYKIETFGCAHPIADPSIGRAYPSSELYLGLREKGLSIMKSFLEQILGSFRGEDVYLEVDVFGLEYLKNILRLNEGCEKKQASEILEKIIRKLYSF